MLQQFSNDILIFSITLLIKTNSMISDEYKQHNTWNNIKINNDIYMVSVTQKDDIIKVFLTNLIEIWIDTLTKEIILDRCRKLNRLLNIETLDYNDIILNILNDMSKYIINATVEHIELQVQVERCLMKFELNLTKGTSEDFWDFVTKPLCISSMEIIHQHKFLLDLMRRKDEEIAEYKAEGAKLIRKNIETKPFKEEQFEITISNPSIIDCTNAFQTMVNFYNKLNLYKRSTIPRESTSSSSVNDADDMHKMEQNIISSVQNDDNSMCKHDDTFIHKSTECIHSENKQQDKDTTSKKITKNKTGTTNMVHRPKKLNKEPEHLPEMLPRRENKKIKRKRCRQCTVNGLRKETNYYCSGCRDNPGLCLGKCFKEYHKLT
ncbi:non-homologous end-joining factor 1-like isoform X1 [Bombus vosnesenskii]|uniref:Non-homologous end-joining factor 1 n=1 Tax=Bombus vosnesenskii TaxID=207650 RepID=A0A6J3KWR4_9HYME|nr:non-homologous end-joining factor 1-like isoform X1 [Bombus vosnesenskii]